MLPGVLCFEMATCFLVPACKAEKLHQGGIRCTGNSVEEWFFPSSSRSYEKRFWPTMCFQGGTVPMATENSGKGKPKARKKPVRRRSQRNARGQARRSPGGAVATREEAPIPAYGTLARTRRLLLAALRLWELKRGIRD